MNNLLGKCASSNIESGTPLGWDLVEEMSKFNHIEVINKVWFKRRDIISDGFDSALLALKDFCPDINIHKYLRVRRFGLGQFLLNGRLKKLG